jgi:hypothetical protein
MKQLLSLHFQQISMLHTSFVKTMFNEGFLLMITVAPAVAKVFAVAYPIPMLPPVKRTVLFASLRVEGI